VRDQISKAYKTGKIIVLYILIFQVCRLEYRVTKYLKLMIGGWGALSDFIINISDTK
jgi:hypothetical protein